MILADTSALLAGFVAAEPAHARVAAAAAQEQGPFVVSPLVLAELDYLITRRAGRGAALRALGELSSGAYELPPFGREDLERAATVIERFFDLGIGLTDASIVVLAERLGTRRVLTLDHRHFGTLRTSGGEPFELVP